MKSEMYLKITEILSVEPYAITLRFNNGEVLKKDFEKFLKKNKDIALVSKIYNETYFYQCTIDEIGGLCWVNGLDLSAEKIYSM